ncbi:SpoIIAA family protein [Olivibacter domesticus]|uniref:SpoIIAA-like n=1 Tax=Olivibacter domesticus TaxID=407022 RepID=A0A1H7KF77_OLID1|nr:STAS/SEC14 domain-containing protein [Olivibacter domesticus]SEK85468.1 SpoIIAA-like [Olivibacter domesticus]
MLTQLTKLPAHVFAVKATDKVTGEELKDVLIPGLQRLVDKYGEIYYLLVLDTKVKNFTTGAWLQDLIAGIKHFKKWTRIAVVTDEANVEKFTNMFNYLAPGNAKGFKHDQLKQAISWVSQRTKAEGKTITGLAAGLVGAIALNVVHETLKRRMAHAPRIDQLGKEAIAKSTDKLANYKPSEKNLYAASLASDLVSNSLFYSLIPSTDKNVLWAKSIVYGLGAGLGAVILPAKFGLNDRGVTKTTQTKGLTIAYYLFGALVTAASFSILKKLSNKSY